MRILLRNGVSYGTFADLAKWIYVDVAAKEFGIKGRKQTTSRVSTITGLSRREVMRVRQLPRPEVTGITERHNRAARVIAAWRREKKFRDETGKPIPLPMEGGERSFGQLVNRFSGNVPPRAILDELMRVGAVERLEDGRVSLIARAYIPKGTDVGRLHLLGVDVRHLLSTIDHNLNPGPSGPLFQRKVAYDNLPDDVLPKFRKLFSKKAQALLESADQWLALRDRDSTPTAKGSGRNRAGFGIFFFEEPYSDEDN
ncbi:MAG: DUF6502 family protein [Desulfobacterales bacterium]